MSDVSFPGDSREKIQDSQRALALSVGILLGGGILDRKSLEMLPHGMCLATPTHSADVSPAAAGITALRIESKADLSPIRCPINEAVGTALTLCLLRLPLTLFAIALEVVVAFEAFARPFAVFALAAPLVERDIGWPPIAFA